MEITINDTPVSIAEGTSLADALTSQNIPAAGIATALNGAVVPSALRGETILKDGDSILIIKAFYGG